MKHIPDAVGALERDLREIFGARLQSLVLYDVHSHDDSGPSGHAQGHAQGHSHERQAPLMHTLAIVDRLTVDDLRACVGRVVRWHDKRLATPLLLAAHEFADSLDAFPLEFGAILSDHIVVSGSNPFDGLHIEPGDLRHACEVQARSHLLHLREGYLETRGQADALAVLIVQSAAPFAALLKSVARLQGVSTHDAHAAGRHAERTLDIPGGIVTDVIKLAGVTEISSTEAGRIFPAYVEAVERLVKFVDAWSAS
jgi:hypothetical protein